MLGTDSTVADANVKRGGGPFDLFALSAEVRHQNQTHSSLAANRRDDYK